MRKAELRRKFAADRFAKEQRYRSSSLLVQCDIQCAGYGVLSTVLVSGQEDRETLLVLGRMGLAQNFDYFGIRELFRYVFTGSQARTQLSAADVERTYSILDFVVRFILVAVR